MDEAIRVLYLASVAAPIPSDVASRLEDASDELRVTAVPSERAARDLLRTAEYDCLVTTSQERDLRRANLLESVPEIPWIRLTAASEDPSRKEGPTATVRLPPAPGPQAYARVAEQIERVTGRGRMVTDGGRSTAGPDTASAEPDDQQSLHRALVGNYVVQDGEVVYANPKFGEIVGRDVKEVIGSDFGEFVHEADRDRVEDQFRGQSGDDRDTRLTEFRIAHPSGSPRYVRVNMERVSHQGAPALLGSMLDVTDRREHDRDLERYETAVQTMPDIIYTTDAEGRLTWLNTAETLGYDREALIGDYLARVMPRRDVRAAQDAIKELLADNGKRKVTYEMDVVRSEGEHVPHENHVALLPTEGDEQFSGTVGVLRDISERKRRENAVAALHETSRELMEATDAETVARITTETVTDRLGFPINGVYYHEDDRLVPVAVSGAARDLFGELPAIREGDGLVWRAFASGEASRHDDVRTEAAVLEESTPIRAEMHLPLGDHGVLLIGSEEAGRFSETDEGLAKTLAGNVRSALDRLDRERDLRERRKELERRNARFKQFASVVRGDLRAALADGEAALADATADVDHARLRDLETALEDAGTVLENALTLAQDGWEVDSAERVGVAGIARAAWDRVAPETATLEIGDVPPIMGNRNGLRRLFESVFGKALRHGGPEVTVRVGPLDGRAGFYIADNGPGILGASPEAVADGDGRREASESDVTLTTGRDIADAHGWEVVLANDEDGARFEFLVE